MKCSHFILIHLSCFKKRRSCVCVQFLDTKKFEIFLNFIFLIRKTYLLPDFDIIKILLCMPFLKLKMYIFKYN